MALPDNASLGEKKFMEWFHSLQLVDTQISVRRTTDVGIDELPSRDFQIRSRSENSFPLDIIFQDDGYVGLGIMYPPYSNTVYLWGWEPAHRPFDQILRIAREIALGKTQVAWFHVLGMKLGPRYLELESDVFSEVSKKFGTSKLTEVRSQSDPTWFRRRFSSTPWS